MNLKNISKLSIAALLCSLTVGSVSSASAADYVVENSWGSSSGNFGGLWVLGTRSDQLPVKFDITSNDGGQTFTGTMTYKGEGQLNWRTKEPASHATLRRTTRTDLVRHSAYVSACAQAAS